MAGGEIERLIQLLAKLPGLGPRSARRAVLHMLKRREALMLPTADAIRAVAESILPCSICPFLQKRARLSIFIEQSIATPNR